VGGRGEGGLEQEKEIAQGCDDDDDDDDDEEEEEEEEEEDDDEQGRKFGSSLHMGMDGCISKYSWR